jgi:alcohol dehydrogenase
LSLRKRGRHVQIGLLAGDQANPPLPMGRVIGWELELYGSHGMAAHAYPEMFEMIASGKLQPGRLIGEHIPLDDAPGALMDMDTFPGIGITVIDSF